MSVASNLSAHILILWVASLAARGLTQASTGFGGGVSYRITPLGRAVLDLLDTYARAAQQ